MIPVVMCYPVHTACLYMLVHAVSITLHSVLSHLHNNNTYARMLFLDFSSAFNKVIPSQLMEKFTELGISPLMCN